jgi:hypothetical protein
MMLYYLTIRIQVVRVVAKSRVAYLLTIAVRPLGTWGCRFVVRGTSVLLRVYRDTTKGNFVSASIPVPSSLASVIERVMHLSLSFVGSES